MEATVYFDGASRGNPGPSSVGWVVEEGGEVVTEGGDTIGHGTSNSAEYRALIAGIEAASEAGYDRLTVVGDSQLIIKQVTGEWRCNADHLRSLRDEARALLAGFESTAFSHTPRDGNERADRLANEALD